MARPPVPASLKRLILPVWNRGHHAARRAGEYLGSFRHGRFGRCDVCGRLTPWLYRRRVIPPKLIALWGLSPRLADALAAKESSDCAFCGAKLRARRLARALLDTYPVDPPAHSLSDWARRPSVASLRVAEVNRIDGLHAATSQIPGFVYSDYTPGAVPGTKVAGVRSEDLCRLTYASECFDLLLTSETLEHVPDLASALAEVSRVLVPGGRHVFTVPLLPGVAHTYTRTVIRPDGSFLHLAPEIRHPGGDVGYPVFTEFGLDFPEMLRQAGFEVELMFWPPGEDDLGQVFLTRKPCGSDP
jgi:SAM-dependent methyltransferase